MNSTIARITRIVRATSIAGSRTASLPFPKARKSRDDLQQPSRRKAPTTARLFAEVVGPPEDAALCDDRGDERGWRDVEGRIPGGGRRGHDAPAAHLLNLAGIPLLDRNGGAVGNPDVDGRERRGDVERNPVVTRQHR